MEEHSVLPRIFLPLGTSRISAQPSVAVEDLLTTYVEPRLCRFLPLALDRPGPAEPHENHHYPLFTVGKLRQGAVGALFKVLQRCRNGPWAAWLQSHVLDPCGQGLISGALRRC